MLWVLWDIFLPIVAAFLVGLLIGWMLWRWRRYRVDATELNTLRVRLSQLRTDADNLRIRNAELSDRLQIASGPRQGNTSQHKQEMQRANRRIELLSSELKLSRQQIAKLRKFNSQSGGVHRVRELEAKLQGAERRITDFENRQDAEFNGNPLTNDSELHEAIRTRDQMIATLKKSLEQFGEREDNTSLRATLALRERRIESLEVLLEEANKHNNQ